MFELSVTDLIAIISVSGTSLYLITELVCVLCHCRNPLRCKVKPNPQNQSPQIEISIVDVQDEQKQEKEQIESV